MRYEGCGGVTYRGIRMVGSYIRSSVAHMYVAHTDQYVLSTSVPSFKNENTCSRTQTLCTAKTIKIVRLRRGEYHKYGTVQAW